MVVATFQVGADTSEVKDHFTPCVCQRPSAEALQRNEGFPFFEKLLGFYNLTHKKSHHRFKKKKKKKVVICICAESFFRSRSHADWLPRWPCGLTVSICTWQTAVPSHKQKKWTSLCSNIRLANPKHLIWRSNYSWLNYAPSFHVLLLLFIFFILFLLWSSCAVLKRRSATRSQQDITLSGFIKGPII